MKITRNSASNLIAEVKKFYEDDEISRMSPNVKDCRLFKNITIGQKEITQIRHLMFRLTEVYELFLVDYAARPGKGIELQLAQVKVLSLFKSPIC